MLAYLVLISLFLLLSKSTIKAQNIVDYPIGIGKLNIIKINPAMAGAKVKGVNLAYETGAGLPQITLQFSGRYFQGTTPNDNVNRQRAKHFKFEIQPKFYGIKYINGIYLGPLFAIYDDGTGGLGATAGMQFVLKNKYAMDANIGVQASNDIENIDNPAPIFIRTSIAFGMLFQSKKK